LDHLLCRHPVVSIYELTVATPVGRRDHVCEIVVRVYAGHCRLDADRPAVGIILIQVKNQPWANLFLESLTSRDRADQVYLAILCYSGCSEG
jgi:hypothetical protein